MTRRPDGNIPFYRISRRRLHSALTPPSISRCFLPPSPLRHQPHQTCFSTAPCLESMPNHRHHPISSVMGHFFGCFKCRKKRRRRVSAAIAETRLPPDSLNESLLHKDGNKSVSNTVSAEADISRNRARSPKDLYKVRQTPAGSTVSTRYRNGEPFESSPPSLRFRTPSNDATKVEVEKKSNPTSENEADENRAFKPDTTDHPLRKRFSDPLSQVDEIEKELENLRRKFAHEADEATKLRDEVRHLRTCGELLESPTSFKKALDNLRDNLQTHSGGEVEEDQLNWPLLSVFAKIESDGTLIEACSSRPLSPFRYLSERCSGSFPQISKNGKEDSTGSNYPTNGIDKGNSPTRRAEEFSHHQQKLQLSASTEKRKTDSGSWERLGIFETSEDLLLEPIDGSSLVTDSEIVTSWENSFGRKDLDAEFYHAHAEQTSLEDTSQSREGVPEVAAAEEKASLSAKLASLSQETMKETTSFQYCSGTTDILDQIAETKEEEFYTPSESTEFLSFSSDGTVLVEDEAEKKLTSDQLGRRLMRCFFVKSSSEELSCSTSSAAVVEETDISGVEIELPSKSVFSFSPGTSSQGQSLSFGSTSDGQAASPSDMFSNTESEADSQSENASLRAQGCFSPQFRQLRRPWRRKGNAISGTEINFSSSVESLRKDLQPSHALDQQQVVTKFKEDKKSHHSPSSSQFVSWQPPAKDETVARNNGCLQSDTTFSALTRKDSAIQWNNVREEEDSAENMQKQETFKELSEQPLAVFDRGIHRRLARIRDLESENDCENSASAGTSEESTSNSFKATSEESTSNSFKATNSTVSGSESVDVSLSEWLQPGCTLQACPRHDELRVSAEMSDDITSTREQNQPVTSLASSPDIQTPCNKRFTKSSNGTSKKASSTTTSASCPQFEKPKNWICSQEFPETADNHSSEPDQRQSRTTSASPLEAQTSPKWKQNQIPLAYAPTSSSQLQMSSNWMHDQWSPAKLADDRPILGTVAAHWSHVSTQKWWDGKGIPNSTNKYKEDQKVNWHATPFEVRLEQALAKQGSLLQNGKTSSSP